MAELLKKAGEIGLLGGGVPEEYGGTGLDRSLLDGALRKNLLLRVVQRERRRAFRHRHAAHRLFRHRRAEEEISAQARHRRMAGLATASRSRRPVPTRRPPARAPCSLPTARTGSSTARRCGSPTADSPTSTSSSPRWMARSFPASSWSAAFPALLPGAEEKKMGLRGSSTTPIFFENCRVPQRKSAARNRPRPHRGLQYSERRPLYAGRLLPGRLQERYSNPPRTTPRNAPPSATPSAISA